VSSEALPAPRAEVELTAAPGRAPLELAGLIALALLAPAAVVYLAFNAGGYFPSTPGFVAIPFIAALVLRCTLAARPFEGFSRALAVPLVALALYAAWQLASALWSHATAPRRSCCSARCVTRASAPRGSCARSSPAWPSCA
jgi:hypothetical protein